jgi:hypothetical protein
MADSSTFLTRLDDNESSTDMHLRRRREGVDAWRTIWDDSTRYQKFANGEQWPELAREHQGDPNRKAARLVIDEINVILQTFSGRQIMNRFERTYEPRSPDAARDAEIMTAIDKAFMHACDAEQVESAAFKDGPGIQGVSCMRWELDTYKERGGGVIVKDLPIWQVMADPEARDVNLNDRAWHAYGKWYPQLEVKARWPKGYDAVRAHIGGTSWSASEAGKSSRIPWTGMEGNQPLQPYYPKGRTLWVEYVEWRELQTVYEVAVPADPALSYAQALAPPEPVLDEATGQPGEQPAPADPLTTQEFTTSELTALRTSHRATFAEEIPPEYIAEHRKLVYKYAYLCGDTTLEEGDVPTGYWTIQFLTGFRFPLADKVTWKSLVSRLVDPQRWVNVMLSALIRNLQINPKGQLFVEDGFFKNYNEAMASWASPGGVIKVNRGAISGGRKGYEWVGGVASPYQHMVEALMSFYRDAIPRLAGFNPGALGQLGSDLRRISGEVVRQVQDSAMTSNAEVFDAKRHSSREGGRIFLSFLRTFFDVGDVIRIVGEDMAYETIEQQVIDPTTGRPAVDMVTGEPLMEPVLGADGVPQRRLVIPPKTAWHHDHWKETRIEDQVPVEDQLQVLWKSLETAFPIMQQPQADTGMPLFTSEIMTEIVPGLPSSIRAKMRLIQRAAKLARQRQMWAQAQQVSNGNGQPTNGQGAPNGANGSPPAEQAVAQ